MQKYVLPFGSPAARRKNDAVQGCRSYRILGPQELIDGNMVSEILPKWGTAGNGHDYTIATPITSPDAAMSTD